ncbi:MAG: family 43 glycosylhydrolase [Rikenellaceae bacterium]
MKNLTFFAISALLCSCGGEVQTAQSESQIPGYNPDAVYVSSIAPDRGLADPHTVIVNDTLYTVCGHDLSWDTVNACEMDRWEVWATTNLVDWEYKCSILPEQNYMGAVNDCFAGDIVHRGDTFYWYFSNRTKDTGVMTAPHPTGPWTDALGEPLIPEGLAPTKSYDADVWEENGEYTIFWGAGRYFCATLGDDLLSLASEPQEVLILEEDGSNRGHGDKPHIFKRGDWYYLSWGDYYSMSKELKGPYQFKGEITNGGHGTMFTWNDQIYYIQENHETNAYYRGVQLQPLYFNEDGTVYIPEHNLEYPLPERDYNFEYSEMGWSAKQGTDFKRVGNTICGTVSEKGAIIASVPHIHTPIHLCTDIQIRIKNNSDATMLKVAMYTYDFDRGFTQKNPNVVDWATQEWVGVPIKPNTDGWQEITIPKSAFESCQKHLHQIAIQPLANAEEGSWEIDRIKINSDIETTWIR